MVWYLYYIEYLFWKERKVTKRKKAKLYSHFSRWLSSFWMRRLIPARFAVNEVKKMITACGNYAEIMKNRIKKHKVAEIIDSPPLDEGLFYALHGYKVSVLVDNMMKNGTRESYVGTVREVTKNYVFLDTDWTNKRIAGIYLPYFMILSVRLYKSK